MCLSNATDSRRFCQLLENSIISAAAAASLSPAAATARRLYTLTASYCSPLPAPYGLDAC